MIIVKIVNSRASNIKKMRKTTVAGGVYAEHSFQSCWMHIIKWFIASTKAWIEIIAM
jgi:hypothetical protein